MNYVMSDLHGQYDKYIAMINRLKLQEDTVYIIGDIVDRGIGGIRILKDLMTRKNVVILRGNHDWTAYRLLKQIAEKSPLVKSDKFTEAFALWLEDGGYSTWEEFKKLSEQERTEVLKFMDSFALYEELTVSGRRYFLSHTVPGAARFNDESAWTQDDFIVGKPDYDRVYDKNIIIVTGHTPTNLIEKGYEGRIWKKNNHIAIDCGAGFGGPVGCICLETGEELYQG